MDVEEQYYKGMIITNSKKKALPIRVGIVGIGAIASLHLSLFSRFSEAKVVALCDIVEEKARRMAQRFSIPHVYAELEEMLEREKLDLVDVCTPPQYHRDILMSALKRGLPCLVEKPLAITTAEADAIIELAHNKNVPVFVIFNYSFVPAVVKAKRLVAKGAIGEVVNVHINCGITYPKDLDPSHWIYELPGGYFGEAGPHVAMLLVEFLGTIKEVKAIATKFSNLPKVKIDELCILACSDKALGSISFSLNCPSRRLTIDILGTKGAIHADVTTQEVVRYGSLPYSMHIWGQGLSAIKNILSPIVGLIKASVDVLLRRAPLHGYQHYYLFRKCLRSLQGKEEYPVDVIKAREAVYLLEMAFREIEKGG